MARDMENEKRLAVREMPEGGVIAWVTRLRDGWSNVPPHRATFYVKSDRTFGYSGCSCDDVRCDIPLWLEYAQLLIDSYNAKVEDFAAETRRASALAARVAELNAFIGRVVDRETVFWDDDEPGSLGLYTAIDYTLTAEDCAIVRAALAALASPEEPSHE